MGGNIEEIQLESKRELYKYNINHYAAVVIKASSKIISISTGVHYTCTINY